MSDISEKVINNLIERNANLEFELEKKQQIIDKAIKYLETNNLYIGAFNSYFEPLLVILKGEKKEKEK